MALRGTSVEFFQLHHCGKRRSEAGKQRQILKRRKRAKRFRLVWFKTKFKVPEGGVGMRRCESDHAGENFSIQQREREREREREGRIDCCISSMSSGYRAIV